MGHYDSCYAADEARKEADKVSYKKAKAYFEKLKKTPVVIHEECCSNDMIMVRALMDIPEFESQLGSKSVSYREYKVYVKTKKQIEAELQAEREKHYGEGI
jgi:hypothetical protein